MDTGIPGPVWYHALPENSPLIQKRKPGTQAWLTICTKTAVRPERAGVLDDRLSQEAPTYKSSRFPGLWLTAFLS